MPVVRYLVFVGGVLLLLLFATDHYFPRESQGSSVAEVDRSVIRIRSTRPLPEKIVFDVEHSPVPAASAAIDVEPDERSAREGSSHDALAMMPQDRPAVTPPVPPASARAGTEGATRHQRVVRSRATHKMSERRMAFEHREFFAGW